MADLSPAAQTVFWAFNSEFDWIEDGVPGPQFKAIAAALRALVGANAYEVEGEGWYSLVIDVDDIYAIAAELEAQ
jgi:hypothetical protein